MTVVVKFFGPAAERAGRSQLVVRLPDRATVADAAAAARREHPPLEQILDAPVRFAVGTDYADPSHPLSDNDVVSVIPPVGGG